MKVSSSDYVAERFLRNTHQVHDRIVPLCMCSDFLLSTAVFGSSSCSIKGKWEVMGSKGWKRHGKPWPLMLQEKERKKEWNQVHVWTWTWQMNQAQRSCFENVVWLSAVCPMASVKSWTGTPFIRRGLKEIQLHKMTSWVPPPWGGWEDAGVSRTLQVELDGILTTKWFILFSCLQSPNNDTFHDPSA